MRVLCPACGALFVAAAAMAATAAEDQAAAPSRPADQTLDFAVMRNGSQIGTSTIRLRRDGNATTAKIVTHIQVTFAYVTVYRFDQTETERWADSKLLAMNSVTNDNGTSHKVTATRKGDTLTVDADGKTSEVDPAVIPVTLWNAAVVQKTLALNPNDGSIVPLSVIDHGEERLVLQGHPTMAHHYSIDAGFPQDVWYDKEHRLVRVELRGSDGSRILYRRG